MKRTNKPGKKLNLAILFSGGASSLEGMLEHNVVVAITNTTKAKKGIERVIKANIPIYVIEKDKNQTKEEYYKELTDTLAKYRIDYICLSGWMSIITEPLLSEYKNRILNVHPADLAFVRTKKILDCRGVSKKGRETIKRDNPWFEFKEYGGVFILSVNEKWRLNKEYLNEAKIFSYNSPKFFSTLPLYIGNLSQKEGNTLVKTNRLERFFKGMHSVRDTFENFIKFYVPHATKSTIHFVTEKVDEGPILIQSESFSLKQEIWFPYNLLFPWKMINWTKHKKKIINKAKKLQEKMKIEGDRIAYKHALRLLSGGKVKIRKIKGMEEVVYNRRGLPYKGIQVEDIEKEMINFFIKSHLRFIEFLNLDF